MDQCTENQLAAGFDCVWFMLMEKKEIKSLFIYWSPKDPISQ